MEGERLQPGGVFQHFDRRRIPWVDFHRPRFTVAQDAIHAEESAQTTARGQGIAEVFEFLSQIRLNVHWADVSAITERQRMQPGFSDQLLRQAEELSVNTIAD